MKVPTKPELRAELDAKTAQVEALKKAHAELTTELKLAKFRIHELIGMCDAADGSRMEAETEASALRLRCDELEDAANRLPEVESILGATVASASILAFRLLDPTSAERAMGALGVTTS